MSGIIIDDIFCENSSYICKYCNSPIWEQETRINYCVVCKNELCEFDLQEQNPYYFTRVATAFIDGNNKFEYLRNKNGDVIIFKNQIIAEIALIYHNEIPDNLYFIEIDYMGKQ